MFDNYNPDFDIENKSFDLFMQEDPDLFYRSIDHEFPELNHEKGKLIQNETKAGHEFCMNTPNIQISNNSASQNRGFEIFDKEINIIQNIETKFTRATEICKDQIESKDNSQQ